MNNAIWRAVGRAVRTFRVIPVLGLRKSSMVASTSSSVRAGEALGQILTAVKQQLNVARVVEVGYERRIGQHVVDELGGWALASALASLAVETAAEAFEDVGGPPGRGERVGGRCCGAWGVACLPRRGFPAGARRAYRVFANTRWDSSDRLSVPRSAPGNHRQPTPEGPLGHAGPTSLPAHGPCGASSWRGRRRGCPVRRPPT